MRLPLASALLLVPALALTACSGGGGNSTPAPQPQPTARPGGPYTGYFTAPVAFDGSLSSGPIGQSLTYAWNFGDGSTATGGAPTHAYPVGPTSTYTVTLTVTDTAGQSNSATTTVTLGYRAPVARAAAPSTDAAVNAAVTFSATQSSDPQGLALTYAWDFGDGTSGTGAQPSHTYTTAGSYTATVTVTDTAGLSAKATATVNVVTPVSAAHAPTRQRFLRNGFGTPGFLIQGATAYDATRHQFLLCNETLNEVEIYDATTELQTGTLAVPSPASIDISPIDGSLYVASYTGDIYQFDSATHALLKRILAGAQPSDGGTEALVLSDGRLADDSFGYLYVITPSTLALDAGPTGNGICGNASGGPFALSGDRQRVFSGAAQATSSGIALCVYDPTHRTETYTTAPLTGQPLTIAATPDGKRFFLAMTSGVAALDATTGSYLGKLATPTTSGTTLPNNASGAVVSTDSSTLFLSPFDNSSAAAFDTHTFAFKSLITTFHALGSTPGIAAVDATGLLFGPMYEGAGFLDGASLVTGSPLQVTDAPASPAFGPRSGGTSVTGAASIPVSSTTPTIGSAWVGNVPAFSPTITAGPNNSDAVTLTTPPSTYAGAVDLTVALKSGEFAIAPEAFSYGPVIREVTPNVATAEGGQTGTVFGYGFGSSPSGVTLTIGGQPATVTQIQQATQGSFLSAFPEQVLSYTIPAGTAGTTADIVVTTSNGNASAPSALRYIATATRIPFTGSLSDGVYDSARNEYFLAGGSQLQVLPASGTQFSTPLSLPGTNSKTHLEAIAESPDGSHLAVSDYGNDVIYVLETANPASAQRFALPSGGTNLYQPTGLAITNSGLVYFASASTAGSNNNAPVQKLDTATGTVTAAGTLLSSPGTSAVSDFLQISPDGTRLYVSADYSMAWLSTSTGAIGATFGFGGAPFAISGDGSTITNLYFWDKDFNPESILFYTDEEDYLTNSLSGVKLNNDGSVEFVANQSSIDLGPRNTGRLLDRVQLADPVSTTAYDPLIQGPGGDHFAVLTTAGVTLLDLSGLPIPASLKSPFPTVATTPVTRSFEAARSRALKTPAPHICRQDSGCPTSRFMRCGVSRMPKGSHTPNPPAPSVPSTPLP